MTEFTKLWATDNNISNLTGLEHATNLTQLSMWQNAISDLTPIAGLTQLTFLNINHNNVSSISALSNLTALTRLKVKQNQITDVSPLLNLVNLNELQIEGNPLTNAHLLSQLTGLKEIDIDIPDPPVVDTTPDPPVVDTTPDPPVVDTTPDPPVVDTTPDPPVVNTTPDPPQQVSDTTPPGVSISVPAGIQNRAFDVVITFTEQVSDFEQADVTLSGTATASITGWSTSDDTVWTARITPTTSGDVGVSVRADVATDAASNNNTASEGTDRHCRCNAPGSDYFCADDAQHGEFEIVITFTEAVPDFNQIDVTLSGTATAWITRWSTPNDTVFTGTVTPRTGGDSDSEYCRRCGHRCCGEPKRFQSRRDERHD